MKTCCRCEQEFPEESFGRKTQAVDGREAACKMCMNASKREAYRLNPKPHKKCSSGSSLRRRHKLRARLLEYLRDKCCIDCNESDPVVLIFDHIDPGTKTRSISTMMRRIQKWEDILIEIAKCEIRCCNCHARRTAVQFNWGKAKH